MNVRASLGEDGALTVHEERTYSIENPTGAIWWEYESPDTLPGIAIDGVRVGEDGKALAAADYQKGWGEGEVPKDDCYAFDPGRNRLYLFQHWDAGQVTVQVDYHVDAVVDAVGDVDYLVWQVDRGSWKGDPVAKPTIVTLPAPAQQEAGGDAKAVVGKAYTIDSGLNSRRSPNEYTYTVDSYTGTDVLAKIDNGWVCLMFPAECLGENVKTRTEEANGLDSVAAFGFHGVCLFCARQAGYATIDSWRKAYQPSVRDGSAQDPAITDELEVLITRAGDGAAQPSRAAVVIENNGRVSCMARGFLRQEKPDENAIGFLLNPAENRVRGNEHFTGWQDISFDGISLVVDNKTVALPRVPVDPVWLVEAESSYRDWTDFPGNVRFATSYAPTSACYACDDEAGIFYLFPGEYARDTAEVTIAFHVDRRALTTRGYQNASTGDGAYAGLLWDVRSLFEVLGSNGGTRCEIRGRIPIPEGDEAEAGLSVFPAYEDGRYATGYAGVDSDGVISWGWDSDNFDGHYGSVSVEFPASWMADSVEYAGDSLNHPIAYSFIGRMAQSETESSSNGSAASGSSERGGSGYGHDTANSDGGKTAQESFRANLEILCWLIVLAGGFVLETLRRKLRDKRAEPELARFGGQKAQWHDMPDSSVHPLVVSSIDGELERPFPAAVLHLIAIGALSVESGVVWCPVDEQAQGGRWVNASEVDAAELSALRSDVAYHELEDLLLWRRADRNALDNELDAFILDLIFGEGDSAREHVWLSELNARLSQDTGRMYELLDQWASEFKRQKEEARYWETTVVPLKEARRLKAFSSVYALVAGALIFYLFMLNAFVLAQFIVVACAFAGCHAVEDRTSVTWKTQHGEQICARLDGLADWIHEHAQDLAEEAEDAKIVDFAVCLSQRDSTMNVLRDTMRNAPDGTRCAQGYLWMWVYGDEPVE